MNIIFRGNVVSFSTTFLDANDIPVDPDSVSLALNFVISTGRGTSSMAMTEAAPGGPWTADWDSAAAGAYDGIAYWSVRAISPHAADDGSFYLSANPANPA